MFHKIENEGFDIISGKRNRRMGKGSRLFYTFMFHLLFKKLAGIQNIENAGNFSMMKRNALNALLRMNEKVRYLPGLRSFIGFNQGFVEYTREDRKIGRTKMNLNKLFMLGADAMFSFSRFPIRLCLTLGVLGTFTFMAAGIYVLIARIAGFAIKGWSSTMLSIYFLGSIQLVFLGVIGEYVFRIYKESQGRPVYIVKQYFGGEKTAGIQ
jgi:dolichol-phosphate mannosyltransferase